MDLLWFSDSDHVVEVLMSCSVAEVFKQQHFLAGVVSTAVRSVVLGLLVTIRGSTTPTFLLLHLLLLLFKGRMALFWKSWHLTTGDETDVDSGNLEKAKI